MLASRVSSQSAVRKLVPEDGEALPGFQPGQFLTFKLYIEGQPRPYASEA